MNRLYQLFFLISLFCFISVSTLTAQQDSAAQNNKQQTVGQAIDSIDQKIEAASDSIANKDSEAKIQQQEDMSGKTPLDFISVWKIFWCIVLVLLGYFFIRTINRLLGQIAERSAKYRITLKGIIPVVSIVGWLVVIVIIIWGVIAPPISTVLAVTASVGLAVGFAAQDILKNIFGGLVILLDSPFHVGDKIEIGSFYGEVLEIGLRSTRIVTADDSVVTIPNGELMNTSVSNSNGGELNCQVVAEIFLPMDVDTEKIRQIATEAACISKYIYLNKPIAVLFFHEIKDRRAYLKMRLKAYVMDIRYEFAFKSDLTEIVIRELLDQHIIDMEDYA